MARKLTNPFDINFAFSKADQFERYINSLSPEKRAEWEQMKNEALETGKITNKALLAGLLHGATLGGLSAVDDNARSEFEKLKKEAPEAFLAGDILSLATPVPGKIMKSGANVATNIAKKVLPKVKGPVAKGLKDIARFGLEGAGALSALEAFQIDKIEESFRRNNGDLMKVIEDRLSDVSKAAQEGLLFGSGQAALVKSIGLPARLRQKRIEKVKQELDLTAPTRRVPSVEQTEIARVLNVPRKQADDFFNTFGKEVEDVVAGLKVRGNLETILAKSQGPIKKRILEQRNKLLSGPQGSKVIDPIEVNKIFDDAIKKVAETKQFDPDVAQRMTDTIKKVRSRMKKNPTVKDLAEQMNFINKQERKFSKAQQAKEFDKAAVLNDIGRSMRRTLNQETNGAFNDVQGKIRALQIIGENVGTKRESVKKATQFKEAGGMFDTATKLIEKSANALGFNPRTLTDALGQTSIRSKTLGKFRDQLAKEINARREFAQRRTLRPTTTERLSEATTGLLEKQRLPIEAGSAMATEEFLFPREETQVPLQAESETNIPTEEEIGSILEGLNAAAPAPTEPSTEDIAVPTEEEVDEILKGL